VVSNKKNSPSFSLKSRTRLPYFPQCYTEFIGRDSPPCVTYTPETVIVRRADPNFSVGKSPRFHLPQAEVSLKSTLPLTHAETIIQKHSDKYRHIGQGYGLKYTYKTSKEDEDGPGPIYKTEYVRSIKHTLDAIEPRVNSTFGCDKDQRAKLMYHGQEKHFYGRESPGPGAYAETPQKVVNLSSYRKGSHFSVPKGDRGLLTMKRNEFPSPFSYPNPNEIYCRSVAKHEGAFSMPKSSRNFNFAKFSSVHQVLVQKGLY
jgi:hypothetical protein